MGPLSKSVMLNAFEKLNVKLSLIDKPISLILGGGGAMILAHGFPRGTIDVDAIPRGASFEEIAPLVKEVGAELEIDPDWLNPYFSTFSHTLSSDYALRLVNVFKDSHLIVDALGAEEMLIMKCFAHRAKDRPHANALVKSKINLNLVEKRLEELLEKRIPGARAAADFLQEVLDEADS